jgi:hypothetical protein
LTFELIKPEVNFYEQTITDSGYNHRDFYRAGGMEAYAAF